MENNLRQQLIQISSKKNNSSSMIAKAILEMVNTKVKPKLEEVASKAFISKSAVVKFCQKLGFGGFTDFIAVFNEQNKYVFKQENFSKKESESILQEYINKCQKNFGYIDEQVEQFVWFAQNVRKFKNVFIYSSSENYTEAQTLYDQLSLFADINVKFSQNRAKWSYVNLFDKESLVIFLVSGIENKALMDIFHVTKDTGALIFLICSFSHSNNFPEIKNKIIVKPHNFFPWFQSKNLLFTYAINLLIYFVNHAHEEYYQQIYDPKYKW